MKLFRKIIVRLLIVFAAIYVLICTLVYFNQESLVFHPDKLRNDHVFVSKVPFEEISLKTNDGKKLNGLLFKAEKSEGLVFYLHGNAGNLESWKGIAKTYTDLNHDLFIFDFRGFGKSEGKIQNEKQFYDDVRGFYKLMLERYAESQTTIVGYSIGTGPAAMLASENQPKSLILLSPYYNLTDLMSRNYGALPTFILKYKFKTDQYLKRMKTPVTIFHGKDDQVIYFGSSLKLKKLFKDSDRFFPLENQGHVGMDANSVYQAELAKMLKK